MADNMFFSRDTKVYVAPLSPTTGAELALFEIPVLDGFSFSQATNSTEVTLNEMSAGSNVSRRGRKMFNDSLAPAEWSFSTYARPFVSGGDGTTGDADSAAKTHAVEEVLWAMTVGDAAYASYSFSNITNGTAAEGASISFGNSNVTTLGTANIYFVLGKMGESAVTYKISKCCVNEVGVDFDIDGITTLNWSGMGVEIIEQDAALTTTNAVTEGTAGTGNFIRNRLTELVAANGSGQAQVLTLTGGSITISNNMTYLTPETLGVVNTPLGHVTGTRSISGSFTCYLSNVQHSSMDLFEALVEDKDTITHAFDLEFKVGGAAAPNLSFDMPKCHLEIPTHSIEDVISLEVNFHALGTDIASDDELSIKYLGKTLS